MTNSTLISNNKLTLEARLADLEAQLPFTADASDAHALAKKRALEVDLLQIRGALQFIELGTYGRCQYCGVEIPNGRLRAIPAALACVHCAGETRGH